MSTCVESLLVPLSPAMLDTSSLTVALFPYDVQDFRSSTFENGLVEKLKDLGLSVVADARVAIWRWAFAPLVECEFYTALPVLHLALFLLVGVS